MSKFKGLIGNIRMESSHEVVWMIDNFCSYTKENHFYGSPTFTTCDTEWGLRVYPNGRTVADTVGWISLYLVKFGGDESLSLIHNHNPISARFIFGVKKGEWLLEVEPLTPKATWVFSKGDRVHGFHKFMMRSNLLQRQTELLPRGALHLTCTLWTGKHEEPCGSLETLSQNLENLFSSKSGCDATVKVMDEEFPVHKLVLSARSPVLAAMFEVDMKEKRTGLVEIPDFKPETVKDFLTFLYSGNVENICRCNAFELYKIADKYDVQDFKSQCLICIMTNLEVKNVLDAVLLASQCNDESLACKTQRFFNQNFREILSTTKWDEFLIGNVNVANKLLKSMAQSSAVDEQLYTPDFLSL